MKEKACSRMWEVEALLDARLSDVEAASTRRHLAMCTTCARELEEHEAVDARMRELPVTEPTVLERRRLRSELLRRANEGLVEAPRRRHLRHLRILLPAFAAVVVVAVALLAFGLFARRESRSAKLAASSSAAAPTAPVLPVYEVKDVQGARWVVATDRGHVRVRLAAGTASFSIHHLTPEQRFVVELPDGELEVRGTRFVIDVSGDRTRGVDVIEGLVMVRPILGRERLVGAGERWEPDALLAAVQPTSPPTKTTAPAPVSARAPVAASSSTLDVGARFDEPVMSFKAGRYAVADEGFRTFLRDFPADPRCEDAAFLRAVARSRMGDAPGAAALAEEYLARFPHGLRRLEAERMRARP
jgi:ferric-dicitrate binding protein FerR (iron transport regulator)